MLRRDIGVVFQDNLMDKKLTVRENLMIRAGFYHKTKFKRTAAVDEAAKYSEIEEFIDRDYGTLSGGQRRRVDIARALLNTPQLLFLDEPFAGLDPINVEVIKKSINKLVNQGTIIILSAHQMNVVEEYCKNILLIDKGKTLLSGNLADIKSAYGINNIYIKSQDNFLQFLPSNIEIINRTVNSVEIKNNINPNEILKILVNNNVNIDAFEVKEPSLQEIFIKKVGEHK